MKLFLSTFLLIPIVLLSQETVSQKDSNDEAEDTTTKVLDAPDKEAEFPGGYRQMQIYLAENIEYPEIAMQLGDQGRVFVAFVVNKDGSIEQVKILKGVTKAIDKEAKRVVGLMPDWIPAEVDNQPVRTRCRIPINFKLLSEEEIEKRKKSDQIESEK